MPKKQPEIKANAIKKNPYEAIINNMTGGSLMGQSSTDIMNGSIPMHVDYSDSDGGADGEERPF
jgi:hypothetical protein